MKNKIFLLNCPELAEAQRISFFQFLYKGISEELIELPNPIKIILGNTKNEDKDSLETELLLISEIDKEVEKSKNTNIVYDLYLYSNEVKFAGPNTDAYTCLFCNGTYSIKAYVRSEQICNYDLLDNKFNHKSKQSLNKFLNFIQNIKKINNFSKKDIKNLRLQYDLFLGEIPLMTEDGTFITNGIERVLVNQIVRSPGVYFSKNGKHQSIATIVSDKGSWTYFILEKLIHNLKKDSLYIEFNDLSLTIKSAIFTKKNNRSIDKINFSDLFYGLMYDNKDIFDSLKHPSLYFNDNNLNFEDNQVDDPEELIDLINNIFAKKTFSIGERGRYQLNKKFNLNLPLNITSLTFFDFINIIDGLFEIKYEICEPDDVDSLKNKQIRSSGHLLQNIFRFALSKIHKNLVFNIKSDTILNLDQENFDNDIISHSLIDFLKTSQLSQFMDQTNTLSETMHKRRVSFFGPNGLKRDHISIAIRDIRPSQYGRLCPIDTSEGQNAGLINTLAMYTSPDSFGYLDVPYLFNTSECQNLTPLYLNPEQDIKCEIGILDTLKTDLISVKKDFYFFTKALKTVDLLTISPLQLLSLGACLVPFVEHNDANRALMGSNMQKQAVPLLYSQKPLVGTSIETISTYGSSLTIKTYHEGLVFKSESNYIIINDKKNQKIHYFLRKGDKSNQDTLINQTPFVWPGEQVFSGQIIADNPGTLEGDLALGKNLTIAYMPWEGHNYEDAIVLNENLVLNDTLTSINIQELEFGLKKHFNKMEKMINIFILYEFKNKRKLDFNNIVKIGSYINENDTLIGVILNRKANLSPAERLANEIYEEVTIVYKDVSFLVPKGLKGRIIKTKIFGGFFNEEQIEKISFYIAEKRRIQVGDKLSGRHGNKGVISKIVLNSDMPILPNGKEIDIIFNPLGVPSRMNVGQIFESLLGLAASKLKTQFKIIPFDELYGEEASRILTLQKLKHAAKKSKLKWLLNLKHPGKILLKDGRTGEYFDNPIMIGKSYILKLYHLVDDKIHARACGPYSAITEQPLAGRSSNGGQRLGEMEVWALEAHGVSNILHEMLTIKADDIDGRNEIYENIIQGEKYLNKNISAPETFLLLVRELNSLGLNFIFNQISSSFNNINNNKVQEIDFFQNLETKLKLKNFLKEYENKQ